MAKKRLRTYTVTYIGGRTQLGIHKRKVRAKSAIEARRNFGYGIVMKVRGRKRKR